MGVLPLQFPPGVTRQTLRLDGQEVFDITGMTGGVTPGMTARCAIRHPDGSTDSIELQARIDTAREAESFRHGGILNFVLREMLRGAGRNRPANT